MENKKVKYLICPNYVISQHDGQFHYIDTQALIRLYGLRRGEYVIKGKHHGFDITNLIHLYPKSNGDYQLTVNQLKGK